MAAAPKDERAKTPKAKESGQRANGKKEGNKFEGRTRMAKDDNGRQVGE
jgi:hypothetical protein